MLVHWRVSYRRAPILAQEYYGAAQEYAGSQSVSAQFAFRRVKVFELFV